MPDDASRSISYTGPSMNPTLKTPDILQVVAYQGKKIHRGDVIVFRPPGSNHMVVHRVISVDAEGVRTRGDHNSNLDPWVLSPDRIVGRVVRAQWGNRRRLIQGGLRGRLSSIRVKTIHIIDSKMSSLLYPIYHRLAQTGLLRRWLLFRMRTRVLCFERSTGTELQLLLGRRVIGRLPPGRNEWVIWRPFRLFVDETSLPRGEPDHSGSSEPRRL